jgi:hypothetical protein
VKFAFESNFFLLQFVLELLCFRFHGEDFTISFRVRQRDWKASQSSAIQP